jgi:hypothetical protein
VIRPTITISVVLAMHLLLAIILRSECTNHFLEPDEIAPTVLYVLPTVVEHVDLLPSIPDPVMRAPMLSKLDSPPVEIPSSPLDIMAVTIPSHENSDYARDDERLEAEHPEASNANGPCFHRSAVIQAFIAFGASSADAPCGRRGYIGDGLDYH